MSYILTAIIRYGALPPNWLAFSLPGFSQRTVHYCNGADSMEQSQAKEHRVDGLIRRGVKAERLCMVKLAWRRFEAMTRLARNAFKQRVVLLVSFHFQRRFFLIFFLSFSVPVVIASMARGIEGNEVATPRAAPKLQKIGSSGTSKQPDPKQRSIQGFFQKKAGPAPTPAATVPSKRPASVNEATAPRSSADLAPAPSSNAPASSSPPMLRASQESSILGGRNKENGQCPAIAVDSCAEADAADFKETPDTSFSSPSRKAKKKISYAESGTDDDDESPVKPLTSITNGRAAKRRRISVKDDSDDEFEMDAATQAAFEDDAGMLTVLLFS